MMQIGNDWDTVLKDEFQQAYMLDIQRFLEDAYRRKTVYPPRDKIFAALEAVNFPDVKVVILGQDPYHGEGQANGMAFAVNEGVSLPPSLVNIYKEIESDLGVHMPKTGSLAGWAKQGILLLNTVLTVEKGIANSHADIGWQRFTDAVIVSLNQSERPIVYILWGANAAAKKSLIASKHYILLSPHPSPLSAFKGFFGSKPFSQANEFLVKHKQKAINWESVDGYEPAEYYRYSNRIKRV